jgi:hypothetical protein
MELLKTTVRLVSNPDYSGEEELVVDRPVKEEECVFSDGLFVFWYCLHFVQFRILCV